MKRTSRSLFLIVLAVSLCIALLAPGVSASPVGNPLLARAADPTQSEIVANALEANLKVDTLKFNMDMTMALEGGGRFPGKLNTVANGTAIVDNVKKEMQMMMNMSIEGLPGQPQLNTQVEYYIVGGWMYMKMSIPLMGARWIKLPVDDEKWKQQQSQVSSIGEWLKTAAEISLQGTEDVDGVPCYVLRVTPDVEALLKWVTEQQGGAIKDLSNSGLDMTQVFRKISVNEWLAKESYLLTKGEVDLLMELPGVPGGESEKMTMTVNSRMKFLDYNQPVSIVLPADAANATEMPAGSLKR